VLVGGSSRGGASSNQFAGTENKHTTTHTRMGENTALPSGKGRVPKRQFQKNKSINKSKHSMGIHMSR
jgi:hypothetical protein